jgi:cytidine deaminase
MEHPDAGVRALHARAEQALSGSYCPYSGFAVGAAVRVVGGVVYTGANIENASYGLTLCAERVAVAAAVHAGHRAIELLVLCTPTSEPVSPCGACRQVLAEFAFGTRVVSFCEDGSWREWSLADLLPDAFDSRNLEGAGEMPPPSA